MAHKTTFFEREILNRYLRNITTLTPSPVSVGLFLDPPTDAYTRDVPTGRECGYVGYMRQPVQFDPPTERDEPASCANALDVLFPSKKDPGTVEIRAFGIFDSLDNLLYWGPVAPVTVGVNQRARLSRGNVQIIED